MLGARTFSDLAHGVPAMSRSMLVKRLAELERAGVIRSAPKRSGRGSTYELTKAGADLAAVIQSLGEWGERWVEVTTEHADPGFALWAWCQAQLDRSKLPSARTVVAFVDWHRGARSWSQARRGGHITVTGPRDLARALPTWNLHVPTAPSSTASGGAHRNGSPTTPSAAPYWLVR